MVEIKACVEFNMPEVEGNEIDLLKGGGGGGTCVLKNFSSLWETLLSLK